MVYGEMPIPEVDRGDWQVEDMDTANYAIEAIAAAEKQITAIEELYQNSLARLNQSREDMLKRFEDDRDFYAKSAEEWAKQEIGEGKEGDIMLLTGAIGFRGDPPEFYVERYLHPEEEGEESGDDKQDDAPKQDGEQNGQPS